MKWNSFGEYSLLVGVAAALGCNPSAFNAILPSNASVTFAYGLPENSTFHVPASDIAFPSSPTGLHALCALQVEVPASGNTSYGFGLFLPSTWNGRFL